MLISFLNLVFTACCHVKYFYSLFLMAVLLLEDTVKMLKVCDLVNLFLLGVMQVCNKIAKNFCLQCIHFFEKIVRKLGTNFHFEMRK